MANQFQLQIYSQVRKVYEGRVTSIVVPATTGYLGVLARHAPLLATLGEGILTVKHDEEEKRYHITGGFLEVRDNVATLLVDRLDEAA